MSIGSRKSVRTGPRSASRRYAHAAAAPSAREEKSPNSAKNEGGAASDNPKWKWGPALLPAPTAPSEGSAGVRNLVDKPFGPPTRSRSWLTSSGVASDRTAPSFEEPDDLLDCASRGFACLSLFWPVHEDRSLQVKTVRCSAALLGITSIASRFAHLDSEEPREPRRATGRSSLPAPLPGWPEKNPKVPLIAGRRRSVLLSLPPEGDWDVRPDHLRTMHLRLESRKRNFW